MGRGFESLHRYQIYDDENRHSGFFPGCLFFYKADPNFGQIRCGTDRQVQILILFFGRIRVDQFVRFPNSIGKQIDQITLKLDAEIFLGLQQVQ